MAAVVAASEARWGRRRRAVVGRRLSAAQHRPPSEAVGGELGPLVVVEAERCREPCGRSGHTSCAGRRAAAGAPPSTIASDEVAASSPCAPARGREPAELPPRHVEVDRVESEPARQVLGRDVVLPWKSILPCV